MSVYWRWIRWSLLSSVLFGLCSQTRLAAQPAVPPSTEPSMSSLDSALDQAEQRGFSGAVMVVRNGQVVFQRTCGLANREQKIPVTMETVFAVGSAPIDFTRAAILLLADEGKLDLDDKITRFLQDVPPDKQSITLRHLMTGRSGLPDFHDLPSDSNPDHSWIDREEAIRRIMAQKLLFPPGKRSQHSHSAWGLLAAVVEIASGETYPEFTRNRLFKPAEMQATGFFGEPIPVERVAVGYGQRKSSETNSPPHWGPTSWLVMGSGGQVSTLPDMLRWTQFVRGGKLLSPKSTTLYLEATQGISSDGDMFGFEFLHSHDPRSMFLLISNSIASPEDRDQFRALGQLLTSMSQAQTTAHRYSLGVAMGISPDGQIVVQQLAPRGAAERHGVQVGDHLLRANGQPLLDDPMAVLDPLLERGDTIHLEVQRDGRPLKLDVKPSPRRED